ncbi:acireductone synthase [Mariniblastus fucicola]|uniref:Enolase-phosphatase E1 n=1 Tax=Mariniblastus fucicola TaxID=980251 RepID=A0A5B9PQI2_9BACT|nr:acireductone synthase [Mariniblastus fucicola]QEG24741.1 Enolase-phosphatase E1 [Mariniblastus fucicola]
MIEISADVILLDIEGTTSSIDFVHDVMFPFARKRVPGFVASNWDSPELNGCIELLSEDLGKESVAAWLSGNAESNQQSVIDAVVDMIDNDVKATGLKQLQGIIWKSGFHSGELVAHLYKDTAPALERWKDAGLDLRIYSSGSIAAQKLFFGHSVAGDLLHLFSANYDTTTGPKKEAESYHRIAADIGVDADQIVFVSDVPAELDAAAEAGFQTVLSLRPGNAVVENADDYQQIESFEQLLVAPNQLS